MIGRKRELDFLRKGFIHNGSLRCALLYGDYGIGRTTLINELIESLKDCEPQSLIMSIDSSNCDSIPMILSSFARKIYSADQELTSLLPKFARQLGSSIIQIESTYRQTNDRENFWRELADTFVGYLEETFFSIKKEPYDFSPIIIFDDIDMVEEYILEWFQTTFNHRIRKSKLFKKCRFLFSSEKKSSNLDNFLAKLGIEKPTFIKIPNLNKAESLEFAKSKGFSANQIEGYPIKSEGNPLKLLNILNNRTNIMNQDVNDMSSKNNNSSPSFSDFSEKELKHLLFASYPDRINRYNLEFFCPPRDAAFCFNWLKRQDGLAELQSDGDLILNEDFRSQMREFHKQEEPEKAEEMSNMATIISAFSEIFPNPNDHWIPINLQSFNSFTKDLCKKLFNELECAEMLSFLENRNDVLNISNKQFSLKDDIKLVTQRFIEIGGGQPKENLCEDAKNEWLKYQEEAKEKRNRFEQEKLNLEEESFDAEKQILSLGELKKQLLENFKNPKTPKSKRELSFSTSIILVVIGIATIGLSLFVDSLGSYHAACGLALTLFGFFWPNIETKKQALATAGSSPKLAIETQQRSLSHRINGLSSRVASIQANLESLNSDLENLDQGMNAPYISE